MFDRTLAHIVIRDLKKYKAIGLVGPRQSGKSTLAKICAPKFKYVSLENPDHRARALSDPRLFLKSCRESTILDEVQNTPEIFSYLQEILDDKSDKRKFILTGSNSFQLNEKISQSLAGRIRMFNVLPLTMDELPASKKPRDLDELLITGLYPRIYDEKLNPLDWFNDYYHTYIQKDIKMILNVSDTHQFDRFVRLCAGRASQLGEYSSIASEVGVSQPTAVRWASVLESSFITFRLQPYFKNFNKKIIKTSKLFFYDTGLLCKLLRINSAEMLMTHPMRGAIFENFIIAEINKLFLAHAQDPPLYFWRDQHGHEIDLLIDKGNKLHCIEIKSGLTFQETWIRDLIWFSKLSENTDLSLVYGAEEGFVFKDIIVKSWKNVKDIIGINGSHL